MKLKDDGQFDWITLQQVCVSNFSFFRFFAFWTLLAVVFFPSDFVPCFSPSPKKRKRKRTSLIKTNWTKKKRKRKKKKKNFKI
jgi:hypothetical protein